MKVQVDFYDEIVTIPLPPSFPVFKNLISHYYVLPEADVNELVFSFDFNGSKNPLSSDQDYKRLLNRPKGFPVKIIVEVSEKSKLFKAEEQKVIDLDEEIESNRRMDLDTVKEYGGKVKDILINQGQKFKELWNTQGEKAKELIQVQGTKAKEMINYHGEKAKELWNNQGGKVLDLWNQIKIKEKVDVVKGKCEEAYYKIQENIPYFKPEEKKQEIVHSRVQCDGCNKFPLVGNRFKCTICQDFDYCEDCERRFGETHNHPFLKIRKPSYAPIQIQCHIYHPR